MRTGIEFKMLAIRVISFFKIKCERLPVTFEQIGSGYMRVYGNFLFIFTHLWNKTQAINSMGGIFILLLLFYGGLGHNHIYNEIPFRYKSTRAFFPAAVLHHMHYKGAQVIKKYIFMIC